MTIIETRPVTSPVGEGLRKTKALLEDEGWCKGSYRDAVGRRCISQAMLEVSGATDPCSVEGHGLWTMMYEQVRRCLVAYSAHSPDDVVGWNDHHDRNINEVYAVLDTAADIADLQVLNDARF